MKRIVAMSLLLSLCCSIANAQPGRGQQGGRRPGEGALHCTALQSGGGGGGGRSRPGASGSSTLEAAGLKLGQPLADLTIFDAEGGEFRLADLKGKYSVIVFGCLT